MKQILRAKNLWGVFLISSEHCWLCLPWAAWWEKSGGLSVLKLKGSPQQGCGVGEYFLIYSSSIITWKFEDLIEV